jgi:hypothetical protein
MSELISYWARLGWENLQKKKQAPKSKKTFKPLDLGGPCNIDLSSRRDWLDQLD